MAWLYPINFLDEILRKKKTSILLVPLYIKSILLRINESNSIHAYFSRQISFSRSLNTKYARNWLSQTCFSFIRSGQQIKILLSMQQITIYSVVNVTFVAIRSVQRHRLYLFDIICVRTLNRIYSINK